MNLAAGTAIVGGPAAQFKIPLNGGITTDGIALYVSDSGNSLFRKINPSTKQVTTWLGTAGPFQDSLGTMAAASIYNVLGIYFGFGTFYLVSDRGVRYTY